MAKQKIDRVSARPNVSEWGLDELLTIQEAARLFWPSGPLTPSSLRRAIHSGRLKVCVVASKHLLTPRAIIEMSECRILTESDADSDDR